MKKQVLNGELVGKMDDLASLMEVGKTCKFPLYGAFLYEYAITGSFDECGTKIKLLVSYEWRQEQEGANHAVEPLNPTINRQATVSITTVREKKGWILKEAVRKIADGETELSKSPLNDAEVRMYIGTAASLLITNSASMPL